MYASPYPDSHALTLALFTKPSGGSMGHWYQTGLGEVRHGFEAFSFAVTDQVIHIFIWAELAKNWETTECLIWKVDEERQDGRCDAANGK